MDEINNSKQLNTPKQEDTSPEKETLSIIEDHQLDINPDLTNAVSPGWADSLQ